MTNNLLVLQSDFGLVDGAVSAMIGVALQEEPSLGPAGFGINLFAI